MSHEERPNFLKIIENLRNASGRTYPNNKTNFEGKTQEEIIDDIRHGIHELHKRGILIDEMSFHEQQLSVFKSLEDWHSGKIKPFPEVIVFDSLRFVEHAPVAKQTPEQEFAKAVKVIWNGMKEVFHSYVDPLFEEINTQNRIEELEKILRKHPNRQDLRMELMKLQKTRPKKIGKPKRKKK